MYDQNEVENQNLEKKILSVKEKFATTELRLLQFLAFNYSASALNFGNNRNQPISHLHLQS